MEERFRLDFNGRRYSWLPNVAWWRYGNGRLLRFFSSAVLSPFLSAYGRGSHLEYAAAEDHSCMHATPLPVKAIKCLGRYLGRILVAAAWKFYKFTQYNDRFFNYQK